MDCSRGEAQASRKSVEVRLPEHRGLPGMQARTRHSKVAALAASVRPSDSSFSRDYSTSK
ncbi:MAG: hypothetical protein ACE5HJ_03640 [Thermoplasmata archaeon]